MARSIHARPELPWSAVNLTRPDERQDARKPVAELASVPALIPVKHQSNSRHGVETVHGGPAYAGSMVEVIVRATATRWESDWFPGWVEASVLDARGQEHRIIEKVPVLTSAEITADSPFPFEFWIDAEMESINGEDVTVSFRHGIETIDGLGSLTVLAADVKWL